MNSVRVGLVQCSAPFIHGSIEEIKGAVLAKQANLVDEAHRLGVQVLAFQEIFNAPFFCAGEDTTWFAAAEAVPDGPTLEWAQVQAESYGMVIVAPVYERAQAGIYYSTTAVIDADGTYLGKYRKTHIPQGSGRHEKLFFRPGNLGFPVFDTRFGKVGIETGYDRHFPEVARALALKGAEILINPCASMRSTCGGLWRIEQPALACTNGVFMASVNRVGWEEPWLTGEFFGSSYITDPRGEVLAEGSDDQDEVVVAECNLASLDDVRQSRPFFRDRRPEVYGDLVEP